jgi:hypothetical protein
VRDWPHARTTRISHVVTDSTRRTNIEYSIRINEEALGKVVERYTQTALGRQAMDVVGRPDPLRVSPRSRGRTSGCLQSFDPAPPC